MFSFGCFPRSCSEQEEFDLYPVGSLADNVQAVYYFETIRDSADRLVYSSFS